MPASVYTEMNHNNGLVEDQRALQLAFELSMLGLNSDDEPPPSNGFTSSHFDENQRKKSANMTECVPVPSSEHVAEIVGRQGCKIKALRAKTNTYIKTPVRGEEPVFVVTGRREDVCSAKREILSAAEHFSQIRASRRNSGVSNGSNGTSFAPGPPSPTTPGQITIQVRVPYRVVGLVVGPKGATIKRIQQQTHTYIVTPSRDKEPVFEVTGLPENVEKARQEIESHIALRTGGNVDNTADSDFLTNGIDSGFHELNGDYIGSIYKPSSHSAFSSYGGSLNSNNNNILSRRTQDNNIFNFPNVNNNNTAKLNEYNALSNGFSALNGFSIYDNDEGISSPSFDPSTVWSDLGDTPCNNRSSLVSLFGSTTTSTVSPRRSSSFCGNSGLGLSPPLTDNGMSSSEGSTTSSTPSVGDHPMVRRIRSDPLSNGIMNLTNGTNHQNGVYRSTSPPSDVETSPTSSNGTLPSDNGDLINGRGRRDCIMCSDGEIVAALVPCGHNMFCMNCANDLLAKTSLNRSCPVCQQTPTQAIRILS